MVSKEVVVKNLVGLHARPATFFIQKSNEFKSGVWVEKNGRRVNAKSLLGVLSLGVTCGTRITVITDGNDEQEALDALTLLIGANLDEESARAIPLPNAYENIDIFTGIGSVIPIESMAVPHMVETAVAAMNASANEQDAEDAENEEVSADETADDAVDDAASAENSETAADE